MRSGKKASCQAPADKNRGLCSLGNDHRFEPTVHEWSHSARKAKVSYLRLRSSVKSYAFTGESCQALFKVELLEGIIATPHP